MSEIEKLDSDIKQVNGDNKQDAGVSIDHTSSDIIEGEGKKVAYKLEKEVGRRAKRVVKKESKETGELVKKTGKIMAKKLALILKFLATHPLFWIILVIIICAILVFANLGVILERASKLIDAFTNIFIVQGTEMTISEEELDKLIIQLEEEGFKLRS